MNRGRTRDERDALYDRQQMQAVAEAAPPVFAVNQQQMTAGGCATRKL
jgi:hypothetical protein